jgi:hypothetical protein
MGEMHGQGTHYAAQTGDFYEGFFRHNQRSSRDELEYDAGYLQLYPLQSSSSSSATRGTITPSATSNGAFYEPAASYEESKGADASSSASLPSPLSVTAAGVVAVNVPRTITQGGFLKFARGGAYKGGWLAHKMHGDGFRVFNDGSGYVNCCSTPFFISL